MYTTICIAIEKAVDVAAVSAAILDQRSNFMPPDNFTQPRNMGKN